MKFIEGIALFFIRILVFMEEVCKFEIVMYTRTLNPRGAACGYRPLKRTLSREDRCYPQTSPNPFRQTDPSGCLSFMEASGFCHLTFNPNSHADMS
jgi:hypothetical protein